MTEDRKPVFALVSTDKANIRKIIGIFSTDEKARDYGRSMLSAAYTLALETHYLDPVHSD